MALTAPKPKELVMMRAVWRMAWEQGGKTLTFETPGDAQRCRMQLYNAVKKIKQGAEYDDLTLSAAAQGLEIVWGNVERTVLHMRRRDSNSMTRALLRELGAESMDEFEDPEIKAQAERGLELMRQLEKLKGPVEAKPGDSFGARPTEPPDGISPEHKDNPFYGKRES